MFNHVPILKPFANRFDVIFQKFLDYKYRVPVCGAVLLTPGLDKCLLVKGWSSGAGWSFPRGKINQGEEMDKCAIREVSAYPTPLTMARLLSPPSFFSSSGPPTAPCTIPGLRGGWL